MFCQIEALNKASVLIELDFLRTISSHILFVCFGFFIFKFYLYLLLIFLLNAREFFVKFFYRDFSLLSLMHRCLLSRISV